MSSSSAVATTSNKAQPKKKSPLFWATECKYEVIKSAAKENGYKLVDDEKTESKCNVFWIDIATIHERFTKVLPWQIVNHFPGMPNIARKQKMGQNLNKMQRVYPREFSFFPRTWILPAEMNDFRQNFGPDGIALNNKIFIIKPDGGCQGQGIFLTREWDKVPPQQAVVAQVYIKKPLLIDNFKFDLRIYILVTCVKPLRMYLFHDGLVRMCTDEYVKPNKQNMHMTTMHLTNYAVNKNSEHFVQPTGTETGEGSKRSLAWFMNMIREEKGDAKCNWLWKRIGQLAVRTVVSILPLLHREYDQHFKSFMSVPYNFNVSQDANSSFLIVNGNKEGGGSGKEGKQGGSGQSSDNSDDAESDDEQQEESEGDESEDTSKAKSKSKAKAKSSSSSSSSSSASASASSNAKKREPSTRGCRCFEILGIDIMMDSALKPWLIEFNHLPSFGTDSPLDQDIKERLMRQVFKILPTRADDEQAYNLWQKTEAARRLIGKSSSSSQKAQDKEAVRKAEDDRRRMQNKARSQESLNIPDDGRGEDGGPSSRFSGGQEIDQQKRRQTDELERELESERLAREAVLKEEEERAAGAAAAAEEAEDLEDEEVSPERMEEILEALVEIYKVYSPDKTNKIARLLQKYLGREEEFLRFVYHKYDVPANLKRPPPKERAKAEAEAKAAAEAAASAAANALPAAPGSPGNSANKSGTGEPSKPTSGKPPTNGKAVPGRKYSSRSVSPPAASARRAPANWKLVGVEEDIEFRKEVLDICYPKDDDIWMEMEMQHLSEFTRIFPEIVNPDEKATDKEEREAIEEEEEDEDEGAAPDDDDGPPKVKETRKVVTIDDMIVQSFAIDKRATMRLHHPLAARMRPPSEPETRDSSSLPPVDNRPAFGSIAAGGGKGVVSWRPPPKKEAKEAQAHKVPTQNQLDAAKRLSLGLSVSKQGNVAVDRARNRGMGSINPAVVLDPGELAQMSAGGINMENMTPADQMRLAAQMGLALGPNGQLLAPAGGQGQGQGQGSLDGARPRGSAGLGGGSGTLSGDDGGSVGGGSLHGMQWTGLSSGSSVVDDYVSQGQSGAGVWTQQQLLQQQLLQQQIWQQQQQLRGGIAPISRQRLMEENRLTRMRLEAARNTPAAVLRQQIYRFSDDPPAMGGGGGGGDANLHVGGGGGGGKGMSQGYSQGLEQSSLDFADSNQYAPPAALYQQQQQQQQQNMVQRQQMHRQQQQQQVLLPAQMQWSPAQSHQTQLYQQHLQQQQMQQHQMQHQVQHQMQQQQQNYNGNRPAAYQHGQGQGQGQGQGNAPSQLQGMQRQQFQQQAQAQRQYVQQQQQQPQQQQQYFGLGGGLIQNASSAALPEGGHMYDPSGVGGGSLRGGGATGGKVGTSASVGGSKSFQVSRRPTQQSGQGQGQAGDKEASQDALLRELFPGWFP